MCNFIITRESCACQENTSHLNILVFFVVVVVVVVFHAEIASLLAVRSALSFCLLRTM